MWDVASSLPFVVPMPVRGDILKFGLIFRILDYISDFYSGTSCAPLAFSFGVDACTGWICIRHFTFSSSLIWFVTYGEVG